MRKILYAALVALGLMAALAVPATAAPADPAVVVQEPVSTAAVDCWASFHARPTTANWYKDPCAETYVNVVDERSGALLFQLVAGVDYQWSMTGGAHIVATRGWGRFISKSAAWPLGKVTEVRLGRVPPFSGVLKAITTDSALAADSILRTAPAAGVGCGSTDNRRIGTTSYRLWTHMWGLAQGSAGQATGDFTSNGTYYYFANDGAC